MQSAQEKKELQELQEDIICWILNINELTQIEEDQRSLFIQKFHKSVFSDLRIKTIFEVVLDILATNGIHAINKIKVFEELKNRKSIGLVSQKYFKNLVSKKVLVDSFTDKNAVVLMMKDLHDLAKNNVVIKQLNSHITKINANKSNLSELIKTLDEFTVEYPKIFSELDDEDDGECQKISEIIDLENKTMLNIFSGNIPEYIKSGFSALDQHIESFTPGSVSFIAARPSVGKSAFALNIATNILKTNKKVVFITLETSTLEVVQRIMSLKLKIPYTELRSRKINQEDWQKIVKESKKEYLENLCLYDVNANSLEKINRVIVKKQPDIVIIDYLHLIEVPENVERREREIGIISRRLKLMALQYNIPFLVLSQLNREIEKRSDKEVKFSDLRDSGSIEQDADLIMFLTDEKSIANAEIKKIKLTIGKNRHGQRDVSIPFGFKGKYMEFSVLENQTPTAYDLVQN